MHSKDWVSQSSCHPQRGTHRHSTIPEMFTCHKHSFLPPLEFLRSFTNYLAQNVSNLRGQWARYDWYPLITRANQIKANGSEAQLMWQDTTTVCLPHNLPSRTSHKIPYHITLSNACVTTANLTTCIDVYDISYRSGYVENITNVCVWENCHKKCHQTRVWDSAGQNFRIDVTSKKTRT